MSASSWYVLGQQMAKADLHYKCDCTVCKQRAKHVATIKAIKAELPDPEYDWKYLERMDRLARPYAYKD